MQDSLRSMTMMTNRHQTVSYSGPSAWRLKNSDQRFVDLQLLISSEGAKKSFWGQRTPPPPSSWSEQHNKEKEEASQPQVTAEHREAIARFI